MAALISVGRASDHTKARNFLKLLFIANANFALFRLVVSAELVAIRPKNDLLARRSFRRGLINLAASFGDGGEKLPFEPC
jgi:hypothetical protein